MSEIALATAPAWLPLLIALINDAPALVAAIEVAKLPQLSPEQMATLQTAMNDAVSKLDQDIAKTFPGN